MIFVGENLWTKGAQKRFGQVCGNSGKNLRTPINLPPPTLMHEITICMKFNKSVRSPLSITSSLGFEELVVNKINSKKSKETAFFRKSFLEKQYKLDYRGIPNASTEFWRKWHCYSSTTFSNVKIYVYFNILAANMH